MLLLTEKLGLSLNFSVNLENRHDDSKALSASLHDFRLKTSNFLDQMLPKPGNESKFMSLTLFRNCFELMHVTNMAFAKLVVEIDYPMSRWGGKAIEEHLNYSLSLLDMLNSVSSSVSHLNRVKVSILHCLNLIEKSPNSAARYLKKIARSGPGKEFRLEGTTWIEMRPGSDRKECLILQALNVLKKIGFLAISLVLSGLDSDANPLLENGKFPRGHDDPLEKVLESRFFREMKEIEGPMEEVKEVNRAVESLSIAVPTGRFDEAARELKERLGTLEQSIRSIDKEADNLFSEVLATRNKLLDNIRFLGKNC